ncbi:hypothetical protein NDU88_003183, partial [Pleurodeles waltl]
QLPSRSFLCLKNVFLVSGGFSWSPFQGEQKDCYILWVGECGLMLGWARPHPLLFSFNVNYISVHCALCATLKLKEYIA